MNVGYRSFNVNWLLPEIFQYFTNLDISTIVTDPEMCSASRQGLLA
jgi:hypothetical protein